MSSMSEATCDNKCQKKPAKGVSEHARDVRHQTSAKFTNDTVIEVRQISRETKYHICTLAEFAAQGHASCMDFTSQSQLVKIIYSI